MSCPFRKKPNPSGYVARNPERIARFRRMAPNLMSMFNDAQLDNLIEMRVLLEGVPIDGRRALWILLEKAALEGLPKN